MTLRHHFPESSGWHTEVLASDISTRVLDRARAGIWPVEKARQIPTHLLKSYMLRGTGSQEGRMKAGPDIQRMVCFERINLLQEADYPRPEPFDLIFCRNVLIYFQPETKAQVVHRLLRRLRPDGYLFLGHSESMSHLVADVRSVIPTVYVRVGSLPAD